MRATTRSGQRAGQMAYELAELIGEIAGGGARRYLEVGVRYGDTFYDVMRALPAGSLGVAVDLPGALWGTSGSDQAMAAAVAELRRLGYRIETVWGNSRDPSIVQRVRDLGPFDFALIDGDHRYEGARADWENFVPLCEAVAFHDIVGHGQRHDARNPVEVPRLWAELKVGRRHREIVAPGSTMGVGIVWPT